MNCERSLLLMLFLFVRWALLTHLVDANETVPLIHSILLRNDSSVPEEYKDLPLVGKCCPLNETLIKDEKNNTVCVQWDSNAAIFSPLFCKFNDSGVLIPGDKERRFVALVGDPCKYKKYMLFPEDTREDMHYLQTNGSIFAPYSVPRMLMPGVDYCMEVIPDLGLRTLVCFPEAYEVKTADYRITFYASGLFISVPFLILTIIAYSITPKLRDNYGKALCHYCACLSVAFTVLAIVQVGDIHLTDQACVCVAFIIQFSFLACFFWLNVMCIETWLLVRNHVNHRTYKRKEPNVLFFYYSIWAWGLAAILIVISMIMDLSPMVPATYIKPKFGSDSCWFNSDTAAMPYFHVPVGLVLLINLTLFAFTAVTITRYQQDLAFKRLASNQESYKEDQRLFHRLKRTFMICVILFFLMGLNWSMELISWWAGGDPFEWSVFDLVNALHGVLVFGLFVLRRPTRDLILYRIQKLRGMNVVEPQICSMNSSLLPVIKDNSLPRQTII